jgi:transposase-like protein
MYDTVEPCPHCQQTKPVVYWGKNRGGSQRLRCRECNKTFTLKPGSNRISAEKQQLIERSLAERLSIEAIARLTHSAKKTIYKVQKRGATSSLPR